MRHKYNLFKALAAVSAAVLSAGCIASCPVTTFAAGSVPSSVTIQYKRDWYGYFGY
jgi:hypothetical protein